MHRSFPYVVMLAAACFGAIGPVDAQQPLHPTDTLTRDAVRAALADTAHGWISYRFDGSARSDSARRLAAAGMWDLEGGDPIRGIRLVERAFRLGVADPRFYQDAAAVMPALRCPAPGCRRLRGSTAALARRGLGGHRLCERSPRAAGHRGRGHDPHLPAFSPRAGDSAIDTRLAAT